MPKYHNQSELQALFVSPTRIITYPSLSLCHPGMIISMKTYQGSCHCGAVAYTVVGEFTEGMHCNCSHCKRKGFLLAFIPDADFTLLREADAQTTYHFNKHFIDHTFCKTCGVQSYGHGKDASGNYMTMINLNCLEDFDLSTITVTEFDGASL